MSSLCLVDEMRHPATMEAEQFPRFDFQVWGSSCTLEMKTALLIAHPMTQSTTVFLVISYELFCMG